MEFFQKLHLNFITVNILNMKVRLKSGVLVFLFHKEGCSCRDSKTSIDITIGQAHKLLLQNERKKTLNLNK